MIAVTHQRKTQTCQAIANGHVTAQAISEVIGLTSSHIFNIATAMRVEGLITKSFQYLSGSHQAHAVFSLTPQGAALAKSEPFTTQSNDGEGSIKDFCNGADYRQWLRAMSRLAKSRSHHDSHIQ